MTPTWHVTILSERQTNDDASNPRHERGRRRDHTLQPCDLLTRALALQPTPLVRLITLGNRVVSGLLGERDAILELLARGLDGIFSGVVP